MLSNKTKKKNLILQNTVKDCHSALHIAAQFEIPCMLLENRSANPDYLNRHTSVFSFIVVCALTSLPLPFSDHPPEFVNDYTTTTHQHETYNHRR
ncbi:hypothetical protein HanPSC8_Chr01g0003441 [Helianthus annuus]|nr:hypothetical protein HanPSC8_Chr01g0003441 [Helianthus annuus]